MLHRNQNHAGLMPQSLRATIGRKTIDLFSTLRHWNLRNLTLQQECYLTSTRDFFPQYVRLYNAAASPASRLRSAGLVGNNAFQTKMGCSHLKKNSEQLHAGPAIDQNAPFQNFRSRDNGQWCSH